MRDDDLQQDERLVLGARWGRLMKSMRELGEAAGSPPRTIKRSITERLASAWFLTVTAETMRSAQSVREHGNAIADGADLVLRRLYDAADGSTELCVPVGDFGDILGEHWGYVLQGAESMYGYLSVVRTIGVLERERRQRPGEEPEDRGRWAVAEGLSLHVGEWIAVPAWTDQMRSAIGELRTQVGRALAECLGVALAALDEPVQEGER